MSGRVGAMSLLMPRLRAALSDPAVRWLAAARTIALIVAPFSLYLLVTRQPLSARGFYVIAINVVAMGQLFETGMGTLLVQFAARTRPSERGTLRGAAEQWYLRSAVGLFVVGASLGTYVLARGAMLASVKFLVPWAVVLACTAAYIRLAPLVCLREGGGDAVGVQRMRAVQAMAVAAATLFGLSSGRGISTAAWAAVAQVAVAAGYLVRERRHLPGADAPTGRLADHYLREQGRSASVWIALWIAPQVLTPATMFLRGAADAGDIGLHVALGLAPAVLSVAWMHARYPRLGALVASGALRTFDDTARRALVQAAWVFMGSSTVLLALAFAVPFAFPFLAGRVLSPLLLAVLLAGMFVLVLFQAMLAWFRAFADERFALQVTIACGAMATGGVCGTAIADPPGAAIGFSGVGVLVATIVAVGFARLRSQRLAGV